MGIRLDYEASIPVQASEGHGVGNGDDGVVITQGFATRFEKLMREHSVAIATVTLTQGFEMQTTLITQAQWVSVMGANPSNGSRVGVCRTLFLGLIDADQR